MKKMRLETMDVEGNGPPVLFDGSGGGRSTAGWHSIEALLRCPKEYQLREIRQIREPAAATPDHFAVGTGFHAGRARWFTLHFATNAKAMKSIEEAVVAEFEMAKLPVGKRALGATMDLLNQYIEHWSGRPRPTPKAAEYLIGPAPLKDGDPFMLHRTARIDDASEYPESGGKLCIGEAKTTSVSIADTVNQYQLHGQPLLQLVLWKMAPQGEAKLGPAAGIMLDIVKKPYSGEKAQFGRVFVPVSPFALNWYVENMRHYLRQAAQIDWDTEVPRNITACTRTIGRMRAPCEFRDLCAHGRAASLKYVMGKEAKSLLDYKPTGGRGKMPWE